MNKTDVVIVPTTKIGGSSVETDLLSDVSSLIIGKKDKTLALCENGIITSLMGDMLMSVNGYLDIPTSTGNFILQWGAINLEANTTVVGDFPIPFPTGCKVILGSHKSNDAPVNVMIDYISNKQFSCTISGGNLNENVQYIAIGN